MAGGNLQRLYLTEPLDQGRTVELGPDQAHYLRSVLRLGEGDQALVFNGRDGEWRGRLEARGKRGAALHLEAQTRPQTLGPDVDYLFAPLKRARLDYMVQKATEMGARRLRPVITRRTQAERLNLERMRANVIEAAEQCGILAVPDVVPPEPLANALDRWPAGRVLVLCDEEAPVASPLEALASLKPATPVAVLIGPEGGFAPEERERLLAVPGVVRVSLGPRVMRADTAAVAALALVMATAGDWSTTGAAP